MLMNYESPLERNLYLAEPSDNAGGSDEGQGSEAVESIDSGVSEETNAPFYTYTGDDGNETAYKDAGEVSE